MFLNKFYEKWNNYSKVRWSYIISDVAQNSHSLKNVWRHVDGVLRGPVFALCAFAYPPPTALFCSPSLSHTHTRRSRRTRWEWDENSHGGAERGGRAGLWCRVYPQQTHKEGNKHPHEHTHSARVNRDPTSTRVWFPQGKLEYLVKWRGWSSK